MQDAKCIIDRANKIVEEKMEKSKFRKANLGEVVTNKLKIEACEKVYFDDMDNEEEDNDDEGENFTIFDRRVCVRERAGLRSRVL